MTSGNIVKNVESCQKLLIYSSFLRAVPALVNHYFLGEHTHFVKTVKSYHNEIFRHLINVGTRGKISAYH